MLFHKHDTNVLILSLQRIIAIITYYFEYFLRESNEITLKISVIAEKEDKSDISDSSRHYNCDLLTNTVMSNSRSKK